jgi:hypothetical protein
VALRAIERAIELAPQVADFYPRADLLLTGLRLSLTDRAMSIYRKAVAAGVWADPYQVTPPLRSNRQQRPSFFFKDLPSSPWHRPETTWFAEMLEAAYPIIRREALDVDADVAATFVKDGFATRGSWTKYDLYMNGFRHVPHTMKCPETTRIIEHIREATSMTSGNIKFSRLAGRTRIPPHCGPSNGRLRMHLGLKVRVLDGGGRIW